jgi:DNA-binding Lrp family transcriptional regulator
MPTPALTDDQCREAWAAFEASDKRYAAAARALGIPENTLRNRVGKARERGFHLSEGMRESMVDAKLDGMTIDGGWIITDKDGEIIKRSTRFSQKNSAEEAQDFMAALRDGLEDIRAGDYRTVKRAAPEPQAGLLALDLADVHVGKLCVKTQTGYEYGREVAVQRMREGTTGLLKKAAAHNVGRVLMVLGNDVLHADNKRGTTTNGTPLDTHGTINQMYMDAQAAYIACIEECAEQYHVDLLFCPSNHDELLGWALANSIGAWFRSHPNVSSSEYSLSENRRKYYRYENNLIGFTHFDYGKEADLYPLMMTEARSHISDALHRYWYLHDKHHKVKKAQGVRPHDREKDHIGMTTIKSGMGGQEGDNLNIEIVRSPSAPDLWHYNSGFVNRQAGECFIHDPFDGQYARFTHWF